MKHVKACLTARKDLEISFHHCGVPVKIVQACLCAKRPDKIVLTADEVLRSACIPV